MRRRRLVKATERRQPRGHRGQCLVTLTASAASMYENTPYRCVTVTVEIKCVCVSEPIRKQFNVFLMFVQIFLFEAVLKLLTLKQLKIIL